MTGSRPTPSPCKGASRPPWGQRLNVGPSQSHCAWVTVSFLHARVIGPAASVQGNPNRRPFPVYRSSNMLCCREPRAQRDRYAGPLFSCFGIVTLALIVCDTRGFYGGLVVDCRCRHDSPQWFPSVGRCRAFADRGAGQRDLQGNALLTQEPRALESVTGLSSYTGPACACAIAMRRVAVVICRVESGDRAQNGEDER